MDGWGDLDSGLRIKLDTSLILTRFINICYYVFYYVIIYILYMIKTSSQHFHLVSHLSLALEAAMMRITIILVCLTFIYGSVVSSDIDLNHLLSKANDEIQSKLMKQMMAGGKSSRMNRKKITAV